MKHSFFIMALFIVALGLGISLWMRLHFSSIGLALLLLLLFFLEQHHFHVFIKARDDSAEHLLRLRASIVDYERQLYLYEGLIKDIETGVILATPKGHIQWSNKSAQLMLGIEQDLLPHYIMEAIQNRQEMANGMAISYSYIRVEGKRRIIVVLKDLRQQIERQQIEGWQQLIRMLIHEIRNSITPIISICQQIQLQAEPISTNDVCTSMNLIERRCRTLMGFMENCRVLSSLKQPVKKPFNIIELFNDLQILYPFCQTKASSTNLVFIADRAQIEQVLINLIKNAQEAHATSVYLEAFKEGIRISDNGDGIPSNMEDLIFKPFFTTKTHGSGIGLSLCRQIIMQHGGLIELIHQEKGAGFRITF